MRVLLDECEDWRLSRYIAGHDVQSAQAMGWAGLKNGALLGVAASQFDAFITVDRNLSFQQNTATYAMAIVVLRARTNRLADLVSLTPDLLRALDACSSGGVTMVGDPGTKT